MADELRSTVRKVGTVIEESAGRMADNTKAAAEGLANQIPIRLLLVLLLHVDEPWIKVPILM